MRTLRFDGRSILGGDRALLTVSVLLLLSSVLLPASFYWSELRAFRSYGSFGFFLSPAFLMLSFWELFRYEHRWRTVLAAIFLLAATVATWGTTILFITGEIH